MDEKTAALVDALIKIQRILKIRSDFVPLGPALEIAPIIREALRKAGYIA